MRRLLLSLGLLLAPLPARAAPTAAELAAAPALWPAEATVMRATRAEVLKEGRPAGAMLLGAGRVFTVTQLEADRVTGRIGGTTIAVPLAHTDVLARAASAMPVTAPASAPPVSPPASAPAAQQTPPPAARVVRPQSGPPLPPTPLQTALRDKLVVWRDGAVRPYDSGRLEGVKFYALYFSASWCGPCREFTPELVRDYAALKQLYPEFELVFVSGDRSEADMQGYLRDDAMPWPALRFADRRLGEVARHAGRGIPCLVLVDAAGEELSHSYRWGRYVGPAQVVEDTWKILKEHRRTAARK